MVELAVKTSKILFAITVIITSYVQTENTNRRHERAVFSSSTQDDRNQNNTNELNNQSLPRNATETGLAGNHSTTHLYTATAETEESQPSGIEDDENEASQNKQEKISTKKTLTSTTDQSVTVWLIAVGVSLPLVLLASFVIYRYIVTQRPVYQVQEICLPGYDRKRKKQLDELLTKYGGKDGADEAAQQKNEKPNVKPLKRERKRATKSKAMKANQQPDQELLDNATTCLNVSKDDATSGASSGSSTDYNGVTLANLDVDGSSTNYTGVTLDNLNVDEHGDLY